MTYSSNRERDKFPAFLEFKMDQTGREKNLRLSRNSLKRQCHLSYYSSVLHSFNLPGIPAPAGENRHSYLTFMMLLFFLALLMPMATFASSSMKPHDEHYLAGEKVPVSLRFHLGHQLLAGSSRKNIRMVHASL